MGPADTIGDGNRGAVTERTEGAAAVRPTNAFGFRAVGTVRDLALDRATVAPTATCVLGSTHTAIHHAVLAAFLDH